MTIFEHIKQQHQSMKDKPRKERWAYFWDYYKWHTIIAILILAVLIQGAIGFVNRKDVVFSGILLNCKVSPSDDAFLQGFYEAAGIDAEKQEAAFYTDIILTNKRTKNDNTAIQRIIAGIAAKDTDFVVGPTESFQICAYNTNRLFVDLRKVLDPETLEELSDKLYYIDNAVMKELSVPVGETAKTDIKYPDPFKPETMKEPIPVGIDVSKCKSLQSTYYLSNTKLYLGIATSTARQDTVKAFIDYLF